LKEAIHSGIVLSPSFYNVPTSLLTTKRSNRATFLVVVVTNVRVSVEEKSYMFVGNIMCSSITTENMCFVRTAVLLETAVEFTAQMRWRRYESTTIRRFRT